VQLPDVQRFLCNIRCHECLFLLLTRRGETKQLTGSCICIALHYMAHTYMYVMSPCKSHVRIDACMHTYLSPVMSFVPCSACKTYIRACSRRTASVFVSQTRLTSVRDGYSKVDSYSSSRPSLVGGLWLLQCVMYGTARLFGFVWVRGSDGTHGNEELYLGFMLGFGDGRALSLVGC
jgi:hypothetical protein